MSLLGVGTVLRLEWDGICVVKLLRQATNGYASLNIIHFFNWVWALVWVIVGKVAYI